MYNPFIPQDYIPEQSPHIHIVQDISRSKCIETAEIAPFFISSSFIFILHLANAFPLFDFFLNSCSSGGVIRTYPVALLKTFQFDAFIFIFFYRFFFLIFPCRFLLFYILTIYATTPFSFFSFFFFFFFFESNCVYKIIELDVITSSFLLFLLFRNIFIFLSFVNNNNNTLFLFFLFFPSTQNFRTNILFSENVVVVVLFHFVEPIFPREIIISMHIYVLYFTITHIIIFVFRGVIVIQFRSRRR